MILNGRDELLAWCDEDLHRSSGRKSFVFDPSPYQSTGLTKDEALEHVRFQVDILSPNP